MKRFFYVSWLLMLLPALFAQEPARSSRGQFEISGRIVNSITGEVVRGASLQLAPVTQRGDAQRVDSASDGSFLFRNLVAGKYSLSAQAPGFSPQALNQHGQFSTAVAVGPDKISSGIIFRIGPEASISGRVLDEHNEAVRNAQLALFEKRTDTGKRSIGPRSQMQTDDLGEYRFTHLSPGTYYLAVVAQPWYRPYLQFTARSIGPGQSRPDLDPTLDVAYPVTYYPGATDADNAGAIVLHPGDRITADFNLTPVQALHITVRTGAGEGSVPVQPNFRERVFGEPFGFMQTNAQFGQGEVQVSGIAPGDYQLNMIRPNCKEACNWNQEVSLQGDSEIDASAGGSLESIHGVLKFDGKNAPANTIIQLVESGLERGVVGRVDEQGEFRVEPPHSGKYIIALGNAQGYAIRNISATGARVSGRSIEFSGSQPVELSINASQGVGIVNGTVMNGDKPLSGAMVVLVPPDIDDNVTLIRRDQSDSDGTFTLPDVVPGAYTAIALQNGWEMEWASPEALRPYLAKGTRIQISGKQQLDVKIAAQ